ncbi:uncharacterized protein [Magallana gigas]|uniref:uncharacterized protein n=1 Tax=Magallana gigas TaxID=29159 RepID=UPI00333F2863
MELMCEVHDRCELLPLYCMDCDSPLCSYCITSNHVGHKFQNVSEVVETQLRQLEESLGNEHAVLHLQNLLSESEIRQKQLAEHRENLLRNVVDREEEIIEKVKLWREKMTEKIISLTDNEEKMLEKDTTLASALLKCKERNLEIDRESIKIISLNCGLRNLLNKDTSVHCFEFRIGTTNDDLFSLFGKLIDETEELSSDICQYEEEEGEEEEDEFHDSLDLKVSMKFTFASHSIDNIVPLQNSKTILLSKGTVYDCDLKNGDLKHRSVLTDVQQIVLIRSCDDVLSLMKDGKCIKRISSGGLLTTYVSTKRSNEVFECVGPGGEQVYACVVHRLYENSSCIFYNVSLLDDFGSILMTFAVKLTYAGLHFRRIFVTDKKTTFVKIGYRSVKLVYGNEETFYTAKTYRGSVGTSPSYAFYPTDVTKDHCGNILVVVPNDNAVHLLDQSLTFQKLLMTEEDGLHRPTSVALDAEGYLYVGCEDGRIHVMNYQYLLNTNRLTRLKIQKTVV